MRRGRRRCASARSVAPSTRRGRRSGHADRLEHPPQLGRRLLHALVDDRVAEAVDASRERDDFELAVAASSHAKEERGRMRRRFWPRRSCRGEHGAQEGDGVLRRERGGCARARAVCGISDGRRLHRARGARFGTPNEMPLACSSGRRQETRPSRGGTGRTLRGADRLATRSPRRAGARAARLAQVARAVNSAGASEPLAPHCWRQCSNSKKKDRPGSR